MIKKIFQCNGHSLFLIGKDEELGKSVIISQKKSPKVKGYKTEYFQMFEFDTESPQIEQYKQFRHFVDSKLKDHDIQMKKSDEGLELAYIFSYFLYQTTNYDTTLEIFHALELDFPKEKYQHSLKSYENELNQNNSFNDDSEEPIVSCFVEEKVFSSPIVKKQYSRILFKQELVESEIFY